MNINNFMFNKRDEYYTPAYLVKPIIKYLKMKKFNKIWCPFDTENSEFVRLLRQSGFDVIATHIVHGQDFFSKEITCDCVVSNPPFSRKLEVLEKLYQLNVPFALLLGMPILNYNVINDLFYQNNSELELLIFTKKATFNGQHSSFNTSYFCHNVLPKQIIFEELTIDFDESGMHADMKGFEQS